MMANGEYFTEHGSKVTISGEHSGISTIEFDWFEEPGACIDCRPSVDHRERLLTWDCSEHDGSSAELFDEEQI